MRTAPALHLVSVLVSVLACSGGSDETSDTGTSTGGDTTTGGDVPDLFACSLPMTCAEQLFHIGPEPADALACAAEAVLAGEVASLLSTASIGPDTTSTQTLVILLGDGTALTQSRTSLEGGGWAAPGAHQLCTVGVPDGLADACAAMETTCAWSAYQQLTECADTAPRACSELVSLLGA